MSTCYLGSDLEALKEKREEGVSESEKPVTSVAVPTAYPPAGMYSSAQSVTLSTTTSGAAIRYTTNGTNPTATVGTVYTTPIEITANVTIKAVAFKEGMTTSGMLSAAYTIAAPSDIDMVWIPAGSFTMGSPTSEPGHSSEETQHHVTLTKGFYMGKYQVTQGQYQAVMGSNPSNFKTPVTPETSTANRPVEQVSWYDAIVFCNKLSMQEGLTPAYSINSSTNPADWGTVPTGINATWNAAVIVAGSTGYRLPTEAQWEYACRAGTTTAFNWGTDYIDDSKANYNASYVDTNNTGAGTYLQRTKEVGSYDPNAWDLYDMHGNVWEWCWDWYGSYSSGMQTDPTGAVSGDRRMVRGGAWDYFGQYARSAYRSSCSPFYRDGYIGFRLARP